MSVTVPANTDALDAMLADPEIRQSLAVIVANAPTLAALASMGTGLLQRGPEMMDNINDSIQQLRNSEGDSALSQVGPALTALAGLAPVAETLASRTDTIQGLLDSPILDPEIVGVISCLGEAALTADKATRGKKSSVGNIFALNRSLKDPDVQATLAFLVEFSRAFGKSQGGA